MRVELARAKINLCLHITGQRDDGMHLLDSIVVFPAIGDVLEATPDNDLSLDITGLFGEDLEAGADNLVMRAARILAGKGAALRLRKNLPVASGIGGGSADAAACIRLLSDMWDVDVPSLDQLTDLGADVPVCMALVPVRMSGIGEKLEALPAMPKFWIVLVNSGPAVETSAVFRALKSRDNAGLSSVPESFPTLENLFEYLRAQRNDLQAAAIDKCTEIAEVLSALEATKNCALIRMSGSGGTCFGLFANEADAAIAASEIRDNHSDWWVVSAEV
ncbi:MAG: 4-(cytidine 5'-diphospho)-2-C-methyl-D-erythritol kinase [Rhodobacteraceae bacterium]|nr:4-(cytidine 5'-diphospho)-2-C-methyl-D-erythritol kinase [Paracoccaceae bacterium]